MSTGPAIVIEGTREDWPGGPRTLTPLDPGREPDRPNAVRRLIHEAARKVDEDPDRLSFVHAVRRRVENPGVSGIVPFVLNFG